MAIARQNELGNRNTQWKNLTPLQKQTNAMINYGRQQEARANTQKTLANVKPAPTLQTTPARATTSSTPSSGGGGYVGGGGGGYVDTVALAQQQAIAEQQAKLAQAREEAKGLAKSSTDAYYNQQVAGFGKTRDQALAEITKAYDDAIATGKMSQQEAEEAYASAVKDIDASAYRDSQLTQMVGFDRGIQNSQQLIGLMQGDQMRTNNLKTDVGTERTKRIQALTDRIAQITKQKDLDIAGANTDYNYNITGARADADQQYNDYLMKLKEAEIADLGNIPSFSGGGSGFRPTSTKVNTDNYNVDAQSDLVQQYGNFVAQKKQSNLDAYNQRMQNLTKKSVMSSGGGMGAYPSFANTPTLSSYEKYRQMMEDFGLR